MLTSNLIEILCCPACRERLLLDENRSVLTCTGCRREYQVRENIPVLLVPEKESKDNELPNV